MLSPRTKNPSLGLEKLPDVDLKNWCAAILGDSNVNRELFRLGKTIVFMKLKFYYFFAQ